MPLLYNDYLQQLDKTALRSDRFAKKSSNRSKAGKGQRQLVIISSYL
jgi:hypothetical protein